MLLTLRSDWTLDGRTWPKGSLLVAEAKDFVAGRPRLEAHFTPTASRSLDGAATTRSALLLSVLDNVAGRIEEHRHDGALWTRREVQAPFPGTLARRRSRSVPVALRRPLLDAPTREAC